MSELPWAPEVEEQNHADRQAENPGGEPGTLALSLDDFSSLEDRILRAVNLVKRERMARTAAEQRATEAEARLNEQTTASRGTAEGSGLVARGAGPYPPARRKASFAA